MRQILVVCAALLTTQCATTPSVEEVNAQRAKMDSDCRAKGYTPGTQNFETCKALAQTDQIQSGLMNGYAATAAGGALVLIPLLLLSDVRAKQDVKQVATLTNGIHLYRFRYRSGNQVYVGVIAQDVQRVMPQAVIEGSDGLLRVNYDALGVKLMTWEEWTARRGASPLHAAR